MTAPQTFIGYLELCAAEPDHPYKRFCEFVLQHSRPKGAWPEEPASCEDYEHAAMNMLDGMGLPAAALKTNRDKALAATTALYDAWRKALRVVTPDPAAEQVVGDAFPGARQVSEASLPPEKKKPAAASKAAAPPATTAAPASPAKPATNAGPPATQTASPAGPGKTTALEAMSGGQFSALLKKATPEEVELAALKACGLEECDRATILVAMKLANRYELDLLAGEVCIIDGALYLRHRALVSIAHKAMAGGRPLLNGIESAGAALWNDELRRWEAEVRVWRRDMDHPFVGHGYCWEGEPRYSKFKAPGMAETRAEVRALRRAFSISTPAFEELHEGRAEGESQVVDRPVSWKPAPTPELLAEGTDGAERPPRGSGPVEGLGDADVDLADEGEDDDFLLEAYGVGCETQGTKRRNPHQNKGLALYWAWRQGHYRENFDADACRKAAETSAAEAAPTEALFS